MDKSRCSLCVSSSQSCEIGRLLDDLVILKQRTWHLAWKVEKNRECGSSVFKTYSICIKEKRALGELFTSDSFARDCRFVFSEFEFGLDVRCVSEWVTEYNVKIKEKMKRVTTNYILELVINVGVDCMPIFHNTILDKHPQAGINHAQDIKIKFSKAGTMLINPTQEHITHSIDLYICKLCSWYYLAGEQWWIGFYFQRIDTFPMTSSESEYSSKARFARRRKNQFVKKKSKQGINMPMLR